ncbi:MAG: prepilin-type N-terminal cleavage/methylation domain-containing protein [Elusimicrobia bacterium]|nr:prepilin-type N-terminal cleavage/methylation domain-containing protein [Elusimicrobiota bacterium]
MNKIKKGFTLIELMIVVAIIGILAAIAIPKFADLIRKSKEGATKGSLGALRSALTIYYGEMEGTYPMPGVAENALTTEFSATTGPFLTKYLDQCPTVKLGIAAVADSNACYFNSTDGVGIGANEGVWWYKGATIGEMHVYVNNRTDTKSQAITSW